MKKIIIVLSFLTVISSNAALAQNKAYAQRVIKTLCSENMAGRGYVNNGVNKAADYLGREFRKLKLKKFAGSYYQQFAFPINTFPTPIACTLDHRSLQVGKDFLLSPSSNDCHGTYKLSHYNLADSIESVLYEKKRAFGMNAGEAIVLHNKPASFEPIDADINIISYDKKMMHSLRQSATDGCQLIFPDSVIGNADTLTINAKNKLIPDFASRNVIGYIPARKKKNRNQYIVFTAHYDHLGKMGDAVFPGASDNASGSAMVLNLAKHYAKSKPDYTMVFILFAGEEVGLIGSDFFTTYPTFNIKNIKTLVNLDIMGSAENGVVVVNATEFPEQFATLQKINKRKGYLPEVRSRGPTQNSDHYHFYKKGIPSFFIYSNGGPGFYHDIYDTPESIPMTNYENVFRLLVDFVDTF